MSGDEGLVTVPVANEALTDEQRRLVRDNIGLVGVHLRRFVPNLAVPRRDREWEDLFQEGCLGLIRAAVGYRAERGIPFAAYALPRIHNAVSRALQSRFSTIYVPPQRANRGARHSGERRLEVASRHPGTCLLSDAVTARRSAHRHQPGEDARGETISERLREKYERAVAHARELVSARTSTRGDRDVLIRVLVEERFLIPHQESRRALRQIARDTCSSYARVAQCDKQLSAAVRCTLETDPEFHELQRIARSDPVGGQVGIDDQLESGLADTCAREFLRRFRDSDGSQRGRMLHRLLELSPEDVEELIRTRVSRLPAESRERLLRDSPSRGVTTVTPGTGGEASGPSSLEPIEQRHDPAGTRSVRARCSRRHSSKRR